MKISSILVTGLVTSAFLLSLNGSPTAHAWTQHQSALSNYNVSSYRTVNNDNYFRNIYNYQDTPSYSANGENQSKQDSLTKISGNVNMQFATDYYLPIDYHATDDFGNPQSFSFVGHYIYVMYTTSSNANRGFVVRYDRNALDALGANKNGSMDIIRQATYDLSGNSSLSSTDKKVLGAMKVGPTFYTGHGQSMAYNPRSHEMWFVTKADIHAQVQRLNLSTLRPDATINFELKSTVPMGEVLTFDKQGNAYFASYASGGWAPKNSVKIYRGRISNQHGVHFKLIMQGLRHAPGTKLQSLGYDGRNLYLVADGSITYFNLHRLGNLSARDVGSVWFNKHREFEGVTGDANGYLYLLTNRGPEIMYLAK